MAIWVSIPVEEPMLQRSFANWIRFDGRTRGGTERRMLIVRVWHGLTNEVTADEYLQYIKKTGVPAYRGTEGNRGAFVFRRTSNGVAEFLVMSFWDSYDAIRRFTGSDNINAAVYFNEDRRYLLFPEPNVVHYEVEVASMFGERDPFAGTA